eukprot:jgi/Botrbrau1/10950/Bobra.0383s0005.1
MRQLGPAMTGATAYSHLDLLVKPYVKNQINTNPSASPADLVIVAAMLNLSGTTNDLQKKVLRFCNKNLSNFLVFWSKGCCPSATISSVINAAVQHESFSPADCCMSESVAKQIANWSCNFHHARVNIDALLQEMFQIVTNNNLLYNYLDQLDQITGLIAGSPGAEPHDPSQLLKRLCLIYDILMTEGFEREVVGLQLSKVVTTDTDNFQPLTPTSERCRCCPSRSGEAAPRRQMKLDLILESCYYGRTDLHSKKQCIKLAGLVMIQEMQAFAAIKGLLHTIAAEHTVDLSLRLVALQGFMDSFTAHCQSLCTDCWTEFLDMIVQFIGPEQPEDMRLTSIASVGRILLHELDASAQSGACERLLLLLVNMSSHPDSTGCRIQQALEEFFKLFLSSCVTAHVCSSSALLLAEALKMGLLRLASHDNIIIEDSCRDLEVTVLQRSFILLATAQGMQQAHFESMATRAVQLLEYEMPWLQIKPILQWCLGKIAEYQLITGIP